MISDVLAPCGRCRRLPERHRSIEHGGDVWWLTVCLCGPRLLHVASDHESGPEPLATRRDLIRTQGALIRLEERVEALETAARS
jgi:hypothetical protein